MSMANSVGVVAVCSGGSMADSVGVVAVCSGGSVKAGNCSLDS